MSRQMPLIVVAMIAFLSSGCSYTCPFEIRGSVQDAATGRPIAGINVELVDAEGRQLADVTSTNAEGKFELQFETTPSVTGERTGWALLLTAVGFEPEKIDVGKVKEPRNKNERAYLIFRASMRSK